MREKKTAKPQKQLMAFIRQITAGIVTVVPLALTIYIFWWIFQSLDSILGRLLAKYVGFRIYGLGLIGLILLIWLAGIIASGYLGKKLVNLQQKWFSSIPLLGTVYKTLTQLGDTMMNREKGGGFSRPVMTDPFQKGVYCIGFITKLTPVIIDKKPYVHVFVPTVPNPTTGFLFIIEEKKLKPLDISIDEAFKMAVSVGMVTPENYFPVKTPKNKNLAKKGKEI